MSLPGGIQRQQEEPGAVIGERVSADSVHKSPLESSNSTISTDLAAQKPLIARAPFNGRNIPVEAPSRGNGMSLPGGIQRQQEEPGAVIGERVSADSVHKSPLESSNSTISTDLAAQKPLIARAPFNGRNIPVEAPPRSSVSSTYPGGIQRLETTGVKEQEESTESLQMQPQGAIGAKSSEAEPQEKEEPNKELVQTKLTVGAPGDKYEQEADSMAAKVMRMPDEAIKPPIQRQTGEDTEAVQMQPLVNSITPVVQRSSEEEEEVQMKSEVQRASDGSSVASGNVENQLAGSKGGGSALPDDVRSFMEPRFGADFSSVRVHTDSNAVQMTKELGAQAFAHGSDIYYGAGKSPDKDELTAHELTHTIQQGGAVPAKPVTGQEKKENKLQAKPDAIEANNARSDLSANQTNAPDVNNVRTGGNPLEKSDRQPTENQSAQRLTPVERFKQRLRATALRQLYQNELHILRAKAKYQKNSDQNQDNRDQNQDNRDQNQDNRDQNQDNTEASEPPQDIIRDRQPITIVVTAQRIKAKDQNQDNTEALGRLRQIVAADERLESDQKQLENSSQDFQVRLRMQTGRETAEASPGGGPNAAQLQALIAQNHSKLNEIKQVRYSLLQLYPASGVLRAGDVKETNTDAQLLATLNDRFENIRSNIHAAIEGIESGDIRPELLESVVAETLKETPEADIAAVTEYLQRERQQENTFRFFGFLAQIGLTVAAIFSGGFLGAVMAALASAMGIGQAAYELEQAGDLNTVAKTGQAGGNQLLADPDAARFNYVMGWVNLVLAGLDLRSVAVGSTRALSSGLRRAEGVVNLPGGEVLARVTPEQIRNLERSRQLQQAGKIDEASAIVAQLQQELGETTYNQLQKVWDEAAVTAQKIPAATTIGQLRQQIPERIGLVQSSQLSNGEVRVSYTTEVKIEYAPDASLDDIKLHVPTALDLLEIKDNENLARKLLNKLNEWLGKRGANAYPKAVEAQKEIEKHINLIYDRAQRLASIPPNSTEAEGLLFEIADYQEQITFWEHILVNEVDGGLGVGYVAAKKKKTSEPRWLVIRKGKISAIGADQVKEEPEAFYVSGEQYDAIMGVLRSNQKRTREAIFENLPEELRERVSPPTVTRTIVEKTSRVRSDYLPQYENVVLVDNKPFADGGNKDVYNIQGQDDRVIAILRTGEMEVLNEEIKVLQRIEAQGLQTLEVLGTTTHSGRPAIIMKKYAKGSKDIVVSEGARPQRVGNADDIRFLNQNSENDLNRILSILQRKQIYIDDLQFLIDNDGHVYIADPIDIIFPAKQDQIKRNADMINLLINAAQENIRQI